MLVAAVAASRTKVPNTGWDDHLLAILGVLFVVGLFHQAWSLRHSHRNYAFRTREALWGWRFAVVWRFALGALLLGTIAIPYLEAYELISLPESDDTFYMIEPGRGTRQALLRLGLLVAVAGAAMWKKRPEATIRSKAIVRVLLCISTVLLCVIMCVDNATVPALVHIAIEGIEAAQPLVMFGGTRCPDATTEQIAATAVFTKWATISTILIPFNLLFAYALASQWQKGWTRRTTLLSLLVVGAAIPATFAVWAQCEGFASVSPKLAAHIQYEPVHRWYFAGVLLAFLAVVTASRLVFITSERSPASDLVWQRSPADYHQRPVCLVVLILTCSVSVIRAATGGWDFAMFWTFDPATIIDELEEMFYALILWYPLDIALLITGVSCLRLARRQRDEDKLDGPFAMNPAPLAILIPAIFVILASGIPTFYWFAFALRLNPI